MNSSAMRTVKIAPEHRLEHRIFGRVKGLRDDDTVEDLECEVPHGEDDDDGNQPREDKDDDLLESLVERKQHPFGSRALNSFLPLHRHSSHARAQNEGLTFSKIPMNESNSHGAFAHCRS